MGVGFFNRWCTNFALDRLEYFHLVVAVTGVLHLEVLGDMSTECSRNRRDRLIMRGSVAREESTLAFQHTKGLSRR